MEYTNRPVLKERDGAPGTWVLVGNTQDMYVETATEIAIGLTVWAAGKTRYSFGRNGPEATTNFENIVQPAVEAWWAGRGMEVPTHGVDGDGA